MIFDIDRLNALRKIVLSAPALAPGVQQIAAPGGPYLGFRPYLNELDRALRVNTADEYVGARLARLERRVIAVAVVR